MLKRLLKNSFVLAISIVFIGLLMEFFINFLFKVENINKSGFVWVFYLIIAFLIGIFYSKIFREVMDKKLRIKVAIVCFMLIFIVYITIFYKIEYNIKDLITNPYFYQLILILVLLSGINALAIYFFLSSGIFYPYKSQKNKIK